MRKFLLSALVSLSALAWLWFTRLGPDDQPTVAIQAPQEGFSAPSFTLQTVSGDSIALADLEGKALILNFWASWCPPCRAEMPAFQTASEEYSSTNLEIIAVNATSQDSLESVAGFLDQYLVTFPILLDTTGQVGRTYQVRSLPTTFFIDGNGVIQEILIGGPIPLPLLRVKANQLLEESGYVPDY